MKHISDEDSPETLEFRIGSRRSRESSTVPRLQIWNKWVVGPFRGSLEALYWRVHAYQGQLNAHVDDDSRTSSSNNGSFSIRFLRSFLLSVVLTFTFPWMGSWLHIMSWLLASSPLLYLRNLHGEEGIFSVYFDWLSFPLLALHNVYQSLLYIILFASQLPLVSLILKNTSRLEIRFLLSL